MKISNGQFSSIDQIADQYLNNRGNVKPETTDSKAFADIFRQKYAATDNSVNEGLKFSKHASVRLMDRNIELSSSQLDRLNAGTQKASEKGINESLVLMDQMAFIVNVKNNTVITAMNDQEMKDNVFTNIDGAVIV